MFSDAYVPFLEILRIFVAFCFLFVSSWYDFKTREVPNRVWLFFAPIGFTLAALQSLLNFTAGESVDPVLWLFSLGVTGGISLALFYLGLFGGADAKALICLSITLPVRPSSISHQTNMLTPLFPLTVLSNAVLASSSLVLVITSYNLFKLIQTKGRLFDGLEGEPIWSKIVAFTTGFKVDSDKLRNGSHYMPLEYLSEEKDGETVRHLRVSVRLIEETPQESSIFIDLPRELGGRIWATPGLPFLVFVTAGFVAALFFGDFVTWFIVQLIATGIL